MTPGLVTLSVLSGGFVGLTLGLVGGGGSIMATPLLLYVIGLAPHQAIGTGAVAVSGSAFFTFLRHLRAGNVRWRSACLFASVGMAGAFAGSLVGKMVDGNKLLVLFAALMLVVGARMLRRKPGLAACDVAAGTRYCTRRTLPGIAGAALGVGLLSGFFGIGGGFLIVPALLLTTGMPMLYAVGSSLLAVGAFGLTTATTYAASGLVDWKVAATFLEGSVIGGWLGTRLACRIGDGKAMLGKILGVLVCLTALYMLYRNALEIGWL